MPIQETSRTIGGMSLKRGAIALSCFMAVACAEVANAPAPDANAVAEPNPGAATPTVVEVAVPGPALDAPLEALADSPADYAEEAPVAIEPEPALPTASPAESAPDVSELAVVAPAAPATEATEPEPSLAASVVVSPSSFETLDFSSLVTRLRKTKAISLRTKVAVKNESDDLLEQARAYHARTGATTLADLRRAYDSLFQELHSLLENSDPPLARDIDRSRTAIWEILADPRKFDAAI